MSTDIKVASKWVKSVWVEYNKDYSEENIYNEDKTGLFYNMKKRQCVNSNVKDVLFKKRT
jgi:hypothetical protein